MKEEISRKINRKDFVKKACLASACLCGFVSVSKNSMGSQQASDYEDDEDKNLKFIQEWISTLLLNIDKNTTEDDCRKIIKPCALAHYSLLEMDKVLSPYIGNIEKFNSFLSKEWGWKIDYNPDSGILTANENKSFCVCPLVDQKQEVKSSVLCYCSEGFAEKMFSEIMEQPVTARVISSVRRGDNSCIYEVRTK